MQGPSNRSVVIIISGLLTLLVLGGATLAVAFRNGWVARRLGGTEPGCRDRPRPADQRGPHPAARRTAVRAWFGLNRAVNLTLSDAPSCRSLETWGRRAARIKNDQ